MIKQDGLPAGCGDFWLVMPLGYDTDTTAVAGGIAGIRFGISGIPERWLEMMKGKEMVEPLIEKLLNR